MELLDKAIKLREDGNLEESNEILKKLVINSDDPLINYQCAWSFDVLEKEKEAIQYYEKAIELGLTGEDLHGALLGLGSTYRTIGLYDKSRQVFEKGLSIFKDDKALLVFYAMTLYNSNQTSKAMEILLTIISQTSSDENISKYEKAIDFYSDKLDQLW